jgi:hypothetical protein
MHKPTIEQTNIAILRSEAQDISAYRNLFGDFHNVHKYKLGTRVNIM